MAARTLLYDIETAPNLAYVWAKYEQDVLAYENEWYILCFSYMWLEEDKTAHVVSLPDFRRQYKQDPTNDFRVVEKLHQLFSAADIVVGHNSNSFDNRKSNARFLVHGMDPPEPYRAVDTCLVARKYFSLNSNKLGDLGETLGIGSKGETHGFSTWLGCMRGEKESWDIMRQYNARDTELLRDVYLRLRPWIQNHPNITMYDGALDACPRCGENAMTKQGLKRNKTTTVQQWKCQACGGWASSRIAEQTEKPTLIN